MKKTIGLVSTATLIMAAGTAAAVPRDYKGSDTLEKFTRDLVTACAATGAYPALAAGEFRYIGGGSSGGGSNLRDGLQDVAPMSRALNIAEACDTNVAANADENQAQVLFTAHPGEQVEQWIIGLDGMAITTRLQNSQRCLEEAPPGDPDFPNSTAVGYNSSVTFPIRLGGTGALTGNTYTVANWRDLARTLWAGADNTRVALADGGGSNQVAANRIARCNSDIRRTLVSDWDNIIQKIAGATDCGTLTLGCQATANIPSPGFTPLPVGGGIRHLLRRDDNSGTTDTFLTLLGLNSVGGNLPAGNLGVNEPFCNGRDFSDRDPIRVSGTNINPSPANCAAGAGAPIATGVLNDETHGPLLNAITLEPNCSGTGLVNAISVTTLIGSTNGVPSTANPGGAPGDRREPTTQELYPTRNCTQGAFELRTRPRDAELSFHPCSGFSATPVPGQTFYGLPDCRNVAFGVPCWDPRCPDGALLQFGECYTPVVATAPGGSNLGDAHCVNSSRNRSPLSVDVDPAAGDQRDGRVWNRYVRAAPPDHAPPGGTVFATATFPSRVLRSERGRDAIFAEYRIRARQRTHANASPECAFIEATQSCRELDATRAIGCLSRAAECAVGFAGREAVFVAGATPLLVGNDPTTGPAIGVSTIGHGPDESAIQQTVDGPNEAGRYQLSRKLYYNSLTGFDNIAGLGKLLEARHPQPADEFGPGLPFGLEEQQEISECLTGGPLGTDFGPVQAALSGAGFLPRVAGDFSTACEEFDEYLCLAAPTLPCVVSADCTNPALPVCVDAFCRPYARKDSCAN